MKRLSEQLAEIQRDAGRTGALVRDARFALGADHTNRPKERLIQASEVVHRMYERLGILKAKAQAAEAVVDAMRDVREELEARPAPAEGMLEQEGALEAEAELAEVRSDG